MSNTDLQWYVCLWGPLLCPTFSWPNIFINPFNPVFGIAIVTYFAFILNPQNATFPKISNALLKPNEQTAPKQFFNGEAHEQLISSIVGLFWGSIFRTFQLKSFFVNRFLESLKEKSTDCKLRFIEIPSYRLIS